MTVTWRSQLFETYRHQNERELNKQLWYQARGIRSNTYAKINQMNPSYHPVHPSIQGNVKQRPYVLPQPPDMDPTWSEYQKNCKKSSYHLLLVITASFSSESCVSCCMCCLLDRIQIFINLNFMISAYSSGNQSNHALNLFSDDWSARHMLQVALRDTVMKRVQ